jgi:hypothetical protein
MKRPRVIMNCVADHYADKARERIIEFSFPGVAGTPGGLISFTAADDGPRVDVYQLDPSITILAPQQAAVKGIDPAAVAELLNAMKGIARDYAHLAFPESDPVVAAQRQGLLDAACAAIRKAEGGAP